MASKKTAPHGKRRQEPVLRIAPGSEGVSIWSAALFREPGDQPGRDFLARAFQVREVASVDIVRAEDFGRIRYESSGDAPSIWRKLSRALSGLTATAPDTSSYDDLAPTGVENLFLEGPATHPIRVHRVGNLLSTWQLRYQSPHRVRLSHSALHHRPDVAYRLEEELVGIPGVVSFRISVLTANVAIQLNPALLNVERLLRRLEEAWPRLVEGLPGPPSKKRFAASIGLLGLAITGQYFVPALRPVAVLGVLAYAAPNVVNAARDLAQGRIGLPALYSTGLAFLLISWMPFAATVMAVFMQLWPQLASGTLTRSQRRLFAAYRRRATWARVAKSDEVEIEVGIETLRAGDLIVIRAGDVVPVDGDITEGSASIDEEALSGEAGVIAKVPGDAVYASTIVRAGYITVRVRKIGLETVAGSIGAQLPHGRMDLPSAQEAEKIAYRMAKPALALGALNLFLTRVARPTQAIIRPDYATGPRLSAQLGALHAIADGLYQGILFRDPAALDRLSSTAVYVFDDAAALERRELTVGEVITAGNASRQEILAHTATAFPASESERSLALRTAWSLEGTSLPIVFRRTLESGGIRYEDTAGNRWEIASPYQVEISGVKIPAQVTEALAASPFAWSPYRSGNRNTFVPHAENFLRPLWVLKNGTVHGVVTFHRQGRVEGLEVIGALRELNPKAKFLYLSSHAQARAEAIAGRIGISTVHGELEVEDKVRILEDLGRRTLWIGEGAAPESLPCIQAGTVSASLGGASGIARDFADIVLFQPSLKGLLPLRRLAREHRDQLEKCYRAVYTANLAGVAGAYLARFGSLQAGLTSNAGTGYVYLSHLRRLTELITRVEKKQIKP